MTYLFPLVFISGILTVLSPCVLPILPIILGSGIDGKKARINGTIVGLIISFTLFALILSSVVVALNISADALRIAAAIILGFFGFALVVPSVWASIQGRLETIFHAPESINNQEDSGFKGGLLTGVVLGLVWTPCVGPIIATVTTLAALQSFSPMLFLLVLSYSLGIALPLFLIARGGSYISQKLGWYKQNQDRVRKYFGVVIVATALLIASGAERNFQAWVLDNLPESIANPVGQFEERFGGNNVLKSMQEEENVKTQNTPGYPLLLRNSPYFASPQPQSLDSNEEVINNVDLKIEQDGAKISLDELLNGGPGKDGIPSIDEPQFESLSAGDEWLENDDVVFAYTRNGETRIYPQAILNWHEIVNDWYSDTPITITFCPLCGTATAFERKVDGVITQFGVSGLLHKNDLVMYDRLEGSLWQQATGEAISGPAARRNEVLEPLFLLTQTWGEVQKQFPEATVLSRDTGVRRDYEVYPYRDYESNEQIGIDGSSNVDDRLHPKTVVYGIEVNGAFKAYEKNKLDQVDVIKDTIGTSSIVISTTDGFVTFTDVESGENIIPLRSFWFAWVSFHPETELFAFEN